jgi:branched-chain amino acid transport system substrate-binding protein
MRGLSAFKRSKLLVAVFAGLWTLCQIEQAASQQEPVKIGLITTLSGPGGYIGQSIRDGFQLALDENGGKLGGVPIKLLIEDDGAKPGQAKQIVDRFLKADKIKLFTGIVFSNVLGAAVNDVLDDNAIYISPNAAPSNMAGKDCNPNYFVTSWQNDTLHESAGAAASQLGYKRAYILAPNYQAGKDALTGFKRTFKGEIVGETYTKLDQTDFAPEMALIKAANPDVVFQFHPGGLGIAFLKQYEQAGLIGKLPMVLPESSLDASTLAAVGESALGLIVTVHWNSDLDNPTSRAFVAAYRKAYGRTPTVHAEQGYNTALAFASGLKAVAGKLENLDAFRAAVKKGDFVAARGPFKFNNNNHPIQDWYVAKVERIADGSPAIVTQSKIFTDRADVYAPLCKM